MNLYPRLSVEALVAPLYLMPDRDSRWSKGGQRRKAANSLVRETNLVLTYVRDLLAVISEEITNRENKTCLLLPPKAFGKRFTAIRDLVVDACRHRYTSEDFRNRIANVGKSLPQKRVGKRSSFVGKSNLVFKSPGRGSARHGLAPTWENSGHELSCVIRGRLRFGASFDPRFHYDCDIPNKSIHLPGCHQPITVPRKRKHINIAPNDNIR